jgi:hypothetical protein
MRNRRPEEESAREGKIVFGADREFEENGEGRSAKGSGMKRALWLSLIVLMTSAYFSGREPGLYRPDLFWMDARAVQGLKPKNF